ncbi:U5 small nuclear ribonucleoprotein 40 kDa protein-like [Cynara cardunculus var. scolymus]|uniref:U5 small nuclear ribonucleoprotein 40 kDa protein-like n=1 Tax=Cynara cardunculus var. scolymus TaxID=59895 RepID=UPI000D62AAA9|nr:U5 small nuclear ribonucleoprotein 40 kDa protein-like [Cynara cardunculus var. scolymus]
MVFWMYHLDQRTNFMYQRDLMYQKLIDTNSSLLAVDLISKVLQNPRIWRGSWALFVEAGEKKSKSRSNSKIDQHSFVGYHWLLTKVSRWRWFVETSTLTTPDLVVTRFCGDLHHHHTRKHSDSTPRISNPNLLCIKSESILALHISYQSDRLRSLLPRTVPSVWKNYRRMVLIWVSLSRCAGFYDWVTVLDGTQESAYEWTPHSLSYRILAFHNKTCIIPTGDHKLSVKKISDGSQIISASPDKILRAWDVETGKQIKKMAEHSSFVNSCCPSRRGPPLIVSGSDDGTAKLWDMRQRGAIQTFPDKYLVITVGFSDASDKIYSGGIDNDVKVWDLKRNEVTMTLQGHQNMITGMQLNPDGSYLLTIGMDCTLRIWDMRPYAAQNRCVKIMEGHQHNVEQNLLKCGWSPDGSKVTAGSSDRMVYIWDTTSRRILYKLPGHSGSVNECVFHPSQPIIGSCSSDKQIYLGEI